MYYGGLRDGQPCIGYEVLMNMLVPTLQQTGLLGMCKDFSYILTDTFFIVFLKIV
jgi:hypothetical protein